MSESNCSTLLSKGQYVIRFRDTLIVQISISYFIEYFIYSFYQIPFHLVMRYFILSVTPFVSLSLSLSLSHTHTYTRSHMLVYLKPSTQAHWIIHYLLYIENPYHQIVSFIWRSVPKTTMLLKVKDECTVSLKMYYLKQLHDSEFKSSMFIFLIKIRRGLNLWKCISQLFSFAINSL